MTTADAAARQQQPPARPRPEPGPAGPRRTLARLQPQARRPVRRPRRRQRRPPERRQRRRPQARHEERRRRPGPGRRGGRADLAGHRLLHRQRRPAGRDHAVRPLQGDRGRRLQLAAAVPDPAPRARGRDADPLHRRRPRHHRALHRPARIGHADRRREHRRDQVRRAVPPERCARLPLREQDAGRHGGAGRRDGGARSGRQDEDGRRARRGARPDRAARARADADHPGPLQGRRRGRRHQPAAGRRAPARAGAGRLRRRAQGRPGARTRQERGAGLCQRRGAARHRYGLAPEGGVRGLQGADRRAGAGRCAALRLGAGRVPEGAAGHARPHVHRRHAADLQQHDQGAGRLQAGFEPAVPAARQADADDRPERAGAPGRRRQPQRRRHRAAAVVGDSGRPPSAGDARARDGRSRDRDVR